MLTQVAINRAHKGGEYGEVLDVLESLSSIYGSAVNAAVQLIRKTPEYQETLPKIAKAETPRRPRENTPVKWHREPTSIQAERVAPVQSQKARRGRDSLSTPAPGTAAKRKAAKS